MTAREIADAFIEARRQGRSLPDYPGQLPTSAGEAYAIQDLCIASLPKITGWKVAGVRPELRTAFGAERTVGPILRLLEMDDAPVKVPVVPDGFAAVEAEFAFRLARDIPLGSTPSEAGLLDAVGSLHIASEIAGSPLATLNDLGPAAAISDHGNNVAVIVGPAIADWRSRPLEQLTSRTVIDGEAVGEGSAARVAGGPLAALAFLVANLAMRGRHLRAGDWVSTGATTGVHRTRPGARALLDFGPDGKIELSLTA